MASKKILFISGSLGLGHVLRDLTIARELRSRDPEMEVFWLAAHPASAVLEEAGENLLSEAGQYANENIPAEEAAGQYQLNLLKYLTKAVKDWAQNLELFKQVTSKESYDLVIGDETYEVFTDLMDNPDLLQAPFVAIYDFIGNDATSGNLLERFGTYMWCRAWAKLGKLFTRQKTLGLFVGELEDIPDRSLGFRLPNRRELARSHLNFTGYVLPFDPADFTNREAVRSRLGYDAAPLIVCTIGGTAVGKDLLDLCGQAFPFIKEKIPDLRMVVVCGPRLDPKSLQLPDGIEVKGYVPALYEHLAACDLAITQGGGATTLELTALRRPFLFFPLEKHFEQELHVAERLARHRAGVRMQFSQTTPESLAEAVVANIGKEVDCASIPTDGARKAAELIDRFL
jgi:UDP-N-acetylglucosamine:LPS N-acetylglucosamine transferase